MGSSRRGDSSSGSKRAHGPSAEQLRPLLGAPGRAGLLFDFDGTLSPIVAEPDAARPLPGTAEALAALAASYRLVAVISGRPGAFLAADLEVPGVERFGSYGLERVTDAGVEVIAEAETWRAAVAAVVDRARGVAPAGVYVEDKGLSVTLHVRNAPDREGWVRDFAAREAAATGLELHGAKMSVELRPPLTVDKGSVVERLVAETGVAAVCFVGDDRGDLSAFRALDRVRYGLRVAVRSDESPPELLAAADAVVEGPAGALALLRALIPPPTGVPRTV